MNSQEKIAWLGRYRIAEKEVDRLTEKIRRWQSRAESITMPLEGMPKSGGTNDPMCIVDAIADEQKVLLEKIVKMQQMCREIEAAIDTMPDLRLAQLLRYRYLNGYTWEQIAVDMSYSYMHICRMHGNALGALKM